jgi:molybdopterin-guanine dinucleotide biosynthesis protein A
MIDGSTPAANAQPELTDCGAIILTGGHSRRMGLDKSSLEINGESFLQILIRRFQDANCPTVIVEGAESIMAKPTELQTTPRAHRVGSSLVFLRDNTPNLGPLEGIRIGLAHLQSRVEYAFVSGVDSPLLKLAVVEYLFSRIGSHHIVAPISGSHIFGLTAVYRTEVHSDIQRFLALGQRSVHTAIRALDSKLIDIEELRQVDPNLESLVNINSPDDYVSLLKQKP